MYVIVDNQSHVAMHKQSCPQIQPELPDLEVDGRGSVYPDMKLHHTLTESCCLLITGWDTPCVKTSTAWASPQITIIGAVVVVADHGDHVACRSSVHQKMPLPIATLMKSTEPWADEYFALDLEDAMRDAGFSDIVYLPVNYRHRVMLGVAS